MTEPSAGLFAGGGHRGGAPRGRTLSRLDSAVLSVRGDNRDVARPGDGRPLRTPAPPSTVQASRPP